MNTLLSMEQIFRLVAATGLVIAWYLLFLYVFSRFRRRRSFRFPIRRSPFRRILLQGVRHGSALVLAVGVTMALLNVYVYHGFGYQPDIYRKGSRDRPWVTITFDDGPSPLYTPRILDILDEYEVPAVFFMVGAHVEAYPELAAEVVARGHEVGNHTWSHINVPTTPTQKLYEQMIKTSMVILDSTGVYPQWIRPPRGMYDGRFRRMADLLGHRVILWTLSSMDWQDGRSAQSIVRRVVDHVKPGDILLFHDSGALIGRQGGNREQTVRSLAGVIEGVRAKGLEFVPLEQLLSDVEGEPTAPDLTMEVPP